MSIKAILQYLAQRRTKKMAKNVSRQPNESAGAVAAVAGRCGACGGEIVEVKANGRRACINGDCGKEAL